MKLEKNDLKKMASVGIVNFFPSCIGVDIANMY